MRATCSAVPARPTARSRSSVSAVATRVSARTLEYDSSPRASACASLGSVPGARATRTRSRAEPRSSPTRQDSHAAHERKPVFQPPRASNSRMRSSRRAVAASRCADSSAIASPSRSSSTTGSGVGETLGVLMFIGESSVALRRLYTPIFERPRRPQDARSRRDPRFFGQVRDAITAASPRRAGAGSARGAAAAAADGGTLRQTSRRCGDGREGPAPLRARDPRPDGRREVLHGLRSGGRARPRRRRAPAPGAAQARDRAALRRSEEAPAPRGVRRAGGGVRGDARVAAPRRRESGRPAARRAGGRSLGARPRRQPRQRPAGGRRDAARRSAAGPQQPGPHPPHRRPRLPRPLRGPATPARPRLAVLRRPRADDRLLHARARYEALRPLPRHHRVPALHAGSPQPRAARLAGPGLSPRLVRGRRRRRDRDGHAARSRRRHSRGLGAWPPRHRLQLLLLRARPVGLVGGVLPRPRPHPGDVRVAAPRFSAGGRALSLWAPAARALRPEPRAGGLSPRRLLVTGLSGLIGGALRKHIEGKYALRALNRRAVPGVETHQADLGDLAAIQPAFKDVDTVVHLAAAAGDRHAPEVLVRSNVVGALNVFEASRIAGVKRVVFASSGATVSGWEQEPPLSHLVAGRYAAAGKITPLTHESALRPSGLYGATKVWGEALARHYSDAHGMSVICLRIGRVKAEEIGRASCRERV